MSEKIEKCPNCNADIKSSFLKTNEFLNQNKTDIINEYIEQKSDKYCSKCGNELYEKYKQYLENEKVKIGNSLRTSISAIPVITTHSPLHWDYDILDMVTGQSTTGTGVLTEFTSSFTDLFGAQSGRHNQKLRAGEQMCFTQLRKQAIDLGGNAVIATDIDYSEIGTGKGMLMVCMSGTVISLRNTEVLGLDKGKKIIELHKLNSRLDYLNQFTIEHY